MPGSTVLVHGDYEYLGDGYYACAEAEVDDEEAFPTCADTLDAYVVPIALERARLAGLAVPDWHLTNEQFEPPAILYGVNPFARNHVVVEEGGDWKAAARKVSRLGKFVICCQPLPPDARIVELEMVLGQSVEDRFSDWARDVYRVFRLPLALVRLIEADGQFYLSAIERLRRDKLSQAAEALFAGYSEQNRQFVAGGDYRG
ncbi:MAG TPA: RimK-like ATPgrasp N-terminal domain-containing protein [Rhodothermales bacterium]|nr:RimK-like ATPgrasp N-terminal domain-containing protein [Rhodothermales bacterium]